LSSTARGSGSRIDVADESECDVVVLGLEPARADNAAAHERELADDGLRQFQSAEQARHCRQSFVDADFELATNSLAQPRGREFACDFEEGAENCSLAP
jgi:hypothetical protein